MARMSQSHQPSFVPFITSSNCSCDRPRSSSWRSIRRRSIPWSMCAAHFSARTPSISRVSSVTGSVIPATEGVSAASTMAVVRPSRPTHRHAIGVMSCTPERISPISAPSRMARDFVLAPIFSAMADPAVSQCACGTCKPTAVNGGSMVLSCGGSTHTAPTASSNTSTIASANVCAIARSFSSPSRWLENLLRRMSCDT